MCKITDKNKVLNVATKAGQIMLENGAETYRVEEIEMELKKIEMENIYSFSKTLIAHAFCASSFTFLFGGDIKDFFSASIIGMIVYFYLYILSPFEINKFFISGIGSALISILGILFYKLHLTDSRDFTIIGSMMLLVPGMALTNGVRDIINGDLMAGIARGLEAFFIATSLAIGSGFIITLFRNF